MDTFYTVAGNGELVSTWSVEEAAVALATANATWAASMPDPETCSDDEVLKFYYERPGYISNSDEGDEILQKRGQAVLMELISKEAADKFAERKRALTPPNPMMAALAAMGVIPNGPHGPGCDCPTDWDEAAKPLLAIAAPPEAPEEEPPTPVEDPEKDAYGSDEAVEL